MKLEEREMGRLLSEALGAVSQMYGREKTMYDV